MLVQNGCPRKMQDEGKQDSFFCKVLLILAVTELGNDATLSPFTLRTNTSTSRSNLRSKVNEDEEASQAKQETA